MTQRRAVLSTLSGALALALCLAAPAFAQQADPAKKKSYEEKLKALAKDDWEGRVKLARWAQENGLASEAKTLLQQAIKAKPDHEEARKLLGYVKHEGKWVLQADLDKIKQAEREKEWREKGFVKYKTGEWVPAADVPYLDKGMVKHGDVWITKEEKDKLDKGFHLVDGEWISPEEAENVKKGLYKVGGKWVTLEEADSFHSNWDTPWKLQTTHFHLVTNLDRSTAEQQKKVVEDAYARLVDAFKFEMKERPTIYLIATDRDYKNFELKNPSEHSSVFAGYIAMTNPDRPGVVLWEKTFGYLYIAHAVAHVYVDRAAQGGEDVPLWFEEGIASYATRYHDEKHRDWSIENIKKNGGLGTLKSFTERMEISIDTVEASQKQITEAGLLAWHCLHGGNEQLKKAFLDAFASLSTGKKATIAKAVGQVLAKPDALEKELKALVK